MNVRYFLFAYLQWDLIQFDVFPFDKQRCLICFALDGFTGSSVNLMDTLPDERQLRVRNLSQNHFHEGFQGNSEWDFVGNLSIDDSKTESDGLQTNTVSTRSIMGIINLSDNVSFPTRSSSILLCLSHRRPLLSYLYYLPCRNILHWCKRNCWKCGNDHFPLPSFVYLHTCQILEFNVIFEVSIGLTTLTSLMLLVTIFADSLAKTNNLSGLGNFWVGSLSINISNKDLIIHV